MSRVREPSQTQAVANVRLYCAQCEAQLGIFDNEWVRLTSSYARSKEPGTHFASEIGERLQTVPKSATALAAGCQMAEVFCRKCSNMVGQYCKVVSDTSQQDLLNQYFYKFSRTFLRDSNTNGKVDAVFSFCPDLRDSSRERSSSVARRSVSVRWQNTPIRQASSTPMTVQTSARNRARTHEPLEPPKFDTEAVSRESLEPRSVAEPEHEEAQPNSTSTQSRRQSARLVEREGRVFEIEGRLRYHEGRLIDQENFMNDQSARIHQQSILIEQQRTKIEEQEFRLQDVNNQLETLQQAMNDLRASVNTSQSRPTSGSLHPFGSDDLAGHLEVLAGAVRNAGSTMNEIQQLRSENQVLKQRLASDPTVTTQATNGEITLNASLIEDYSAVQTLGKRKRDGQQDAQVLTPQSDRSNRPFLAEQVDTGDAINIVGPGQDTSTMLHDPALVSLYDMTVQTDSQVPNISAAAFQGMQPVDSMQVDIDLGRPFSSTAMMPVENTVLIADSTSQIRPEQGQRALPEGLATDFVQDPAAFEDLAFSDEDEDESTYRIFGIEDAAELDGPLEASNEGHQALRDNRSTAPEPLLKPKPPANRKRSYITLDRAHIATPHVFWEAITNGRQPKAIKPPAIQTRKKDLEDELRALGLEEWIPRDKKSKEYRAAVSAARTRVRAFKKAALLSSNGILPDTIDVSQPPPHPDPVPVLTAIQNVPAMIAASTVHDPQYASGNENGDTLSKPAAAAAAAATTDDVSQALPSLAPSPPRTRRSTREHGGNAVEPVQTSEVVSGGPSEHVDDQPAKRTRSKAQARSQRQSGPASTVAPEKEAEQGQEQKKARGRPRKSAPAVITVQSNEAAVAATETEQPPNVSDEIPGTPTDGAEDLPSPQIAGNTTASKQKLLEKMRLKALQKEQMRDQVILARDKLAEEAMAAMEMKDMMA